MRSLRGAGCIGAIASLLAACSGGSNSGDPTGTSTPPASSADSGCTGQCANAASFLTVAEIQTIIAQAVGEAQAQNTPATIAVVDRVGNVLGVFRMNGARTSVRISSDRNVAGGLEGLAIVPSELAAISKAVTGAYLSSEGNAFSTRTASQIVQEHFNPREFGAPSGPLFGVQFSQLVCSDLVQPPSGLLFGLGPKPSPLGLSADPGGLPLYKSGTVVGGIGVSADETYGLDANISDRDRNPDELSAVAGTFGFGAPLDRRGDRITADGKTFRFSDVDFADLARAPSTATPFATINGSVGSLMAVPLFTDAAIRAGVAFGQVESGIRADLNDYPGRDAFVLVDGANVNRYPPIAGTDGAQALTAAEARRITDEALGVANRARAQIRRPTDSQARVTISVVDTNGVVLALARTRDAPLFGTDVSLQKARTAAFFSGAYAAADLNTLPNAVYLNANGAPSGVQIRFSDYVGATRSFFGIPSFLADGAFAITPRAVGNFARPYYPDGIVGTDAGPFSKPFPNWSPFSDGLQLDLNFNALANTLTLYLGVRDGSIGAADAIARLPLGNCTGVTLGAPPAAPGTVSTRMRNGMQIFPGAAPIYRGNVLVGAIGVSGDGIDQDDMISFLGLHNASVALNGSVGNAPSALRADQLVPQGARLRYVQCPQAPFLGSNEQNVCEGK